METFPQIEKITRRETNLEVPPTGGTFISILRNGDDYRGNPKQLEEARNFPEGLEVGKLMPSAALEARTFSENQLAGLIEKLTPEEREQLDIIVVASDTELGPLATSDGSTPFPHQRCVETGKFLLEGIEKAMSDTGLNSEHLLNLKFHKDEEAGGAQPLAIRDIEDLQMRPRTEEFFAFLKAQAAERISKGQKANIWVMYETDEFKKEREEMNVEGPEEISARMQAFIDRAEKLASAQHKRTPDRRLLVLAVAPRDLVGPWLNIQVAGLSPEGYEIPRIENLAGFGVVISPNGQSRIKLGDKEAVLN